MTQDTIATMRDLRARIGPMQRILRNQNYPTVKLLSETMNSPAIRAMDLFLNGPSTRLLREMRLSPVAQMIMRAGIAAQSPSNQIGGMSQAVASLASVGRNYAALGNHVLPFAAQVPRLFSLPMITWAGNTFAVSRVIEVLHGEPRDPEVRANGDHVLRQGPMHVTDLDRHLAQLDPRLVQMRQGALQALHSKNPDRFQQAAHSGRQLLDGVLIRKAPDAAFTPEEIAPKGRVTRHMRAVKALGPSVHRREAEWRASLADAMDATYTMLADVAHTGKPIGDAISAALVACDAFVFALLTRGNT